MYYFIIPGCIKYEDGPWIILVSRKTRLIDSYTYSKVLFNGLDVTSGTIQGTIDYSKSSIGFDDENRFSSFISKVNDPNDFKSVREHLVKTLSFWSLHLMMDLC